VVKHFTGRGCTSTADIRATLANLSFVDLHGRLSIAEPLAALTEAVGAAVESGAAVDAPLVVVNIEGALARSADKAFYADLPGRKPLVWAEFAASQMMLGATRGADVPTMATVYSIFDSLSEFAIAHSKLASFQHQAIAAASASLGAPLPHSSNAYGGRFQHNVLQLQQLHPPMHEDWLEEHHVLAAASGESDNDKADIPEVTYSDGGGRVQASAAYIKRGPYSDGGGPIHPYSRNYG
jgi:hypothetical protein